MREGKVRNSRRPSQAFFRLVIKHAASTHQRRSAFASIDARRCPARPQTCRSEGRLQLQSGDQVFEARVVAKTVVNGIGVQELQAITAIAKTSF
jgi:hypothetical protein